MKTNLLFIPALALALFATSCKSNTEEASAKVQVHTLTLKDTTCTIEYSYPATIAGLQDVEIYPQVTGRITAIKVIEGQFVNKGDVLFEIDDVPYKSAYQQALAQVEVSKAQLETAKLTCKSKQNLYDRQIISEYQLDLAKNDVVTAAAVLGQSMAALRAAENDLSFTKVRTMGKGYIGTLPYKVGSLVQPALLKPLTVVSDNSSIYADFSIPENTYLELQEALQASIDEKIGTMPIKLVTNLGSKYEHEGRVHSLSGLISSETGSIPVRSIFPNPDRILLSGGACSVVFSMESKNALIVPRTSIKEIQNKQFVFIVKDGVLCQTEVKASRYDSSNWIINPNEDGTYSVKAGDVITTTTNRLQNGMEAEIIK